MNARNLLLATIIASGFVAWPIIGNYSGAGGGWISTVVGAGTAAVIVLLSMKELASSSPPALNEFLLLTIAGVLNGGMVYLYAIKTADKTTSPAIFMVTVSILMTICAPLFSWALSGAAPTGRQMAGFGLATVTIYLLR